VTKFRAETVHRVLQISRAGSNYYNQCFDFWKCLLDGRWKLHRITLSVVMRIITCC